MRLDSYLAKTHPEFSRSVWQKYIKAGFVKVNNKSATGSDPVADFDDIKINIPKADEEPIELPIVYEDNNVIVINKPAGILTHSKGALNEEFTISDFIRSRVTSFSGSTRAKRSERTESSQKSLDSPVKPENDKILRTYETIEMGTNDHIAKLIARLDEEAHRFAVSYHQTLRGKKQTENALEQIPGIGPATRKKLIKRFGSVSGIKKASETEIAQIVGIMKAKLVQQNLK